jgi:hypothetical protein
VVPDTGVTVHVTLEAVPTLVTFAAVNPVTASEKTIVKLIGVELVATGWAAAFEKDATVGATPSWTYETRLVHKDVLFAASTTLPNMVVVALAVSEVVGILREPSPLTGLEMALEHSALSNSVTVTEEAVLSATLTVTFGVRLLPGVAGDIDEYVMVGAVLSILIRRP